jgi:hypothetical protein
MDALPERGACGPCTMCCKLLGVEELGKAMDAWCPHCAKGRGCGIYGSRPQSCRDFACAWLATVEAGLPVDQAMRPDRCHVVFHEPVGRGAGNLIAHVDPAYPKSWTEGAVSRHIADVASGGGTVAVQAGSRHYIVDPSGVHVATVSGTLPEGGLSLVRGRRIGGFG